MLLPTPDRNLTTTSFRRRGFSLVEILVVIGILAILAGVLIPTITRVLPSARETISRANLEELNQAVLRFHQANWELVLEADDDSNDDEVAIVRSLQYRGANPAPGSPYLDPTMTIESSDDETTFRASWNGRVFQMLEPGTSGSGLDLARMHSSGTAFAFNENYQPVGAP